MATKTIPARLNKRLDNEQLNHVSRQLCNDIEGLFEALSLPAPKLRGKCIKCPCPVHGGDSPAGLNLYPGGDFPGNWVCQTAGCHKVYQPTIIGFVRGVLSHKAGKDIGFGAALDWCQHYLNQDLASIEVDCAAAEKRKFAAQVAFMAGDEESEEPATGRITRKVVRKHLEIPSPYMISRGFSPEILSKYDIGESKAHEMKGRCVCPSYDDDYKYMVGCTGRSLNPKCEACGLYHDEDDGCPENDLERWKAAKHRNSRGFQAEKTLFNYWHAKRFIYETKVVCLVESAGNVLRLEESGIHVGLGMYGVSLKDSQRLKLDRSGAMCVCLLLDNDDAGRKARKILEEELRRSYRVVQLYVPETRNDVAEMPVPDVQDLLLPKFEKLYRELSCD